MGASVLHDGFMCAIGREREAIGIGLTQTRQLLDLLRKAERSLYHLARRRLRLEANGWIFQILCGRFEASILCRL
jgi:hypothetical protein